MSSRFPSGREFGYWFMPGSASQVPIPPGSRSEEAGTKRPLPEMERLQYALFLRSVKQRTQGAATFGPSLPSLDLLSPSSSSASFATPLIPSPTISSVSSPFGFQGRPELPFSPLPSSDPAPAAVLLESSRRLAAPGDMKNQLEELERRLLQDDDEGDEDVSAIGASGFAISDTDWSKKIQQLISSPSAAAAPPTSQLIAALATAAAVSPLCPSPTNSTSSCSTISSSASCSPPSTPSSRQMLFETASAMVDGNLDAATTYLAILKLSANSRGDVEQRLTAIMVSALLSRLNPPQPPQVESSASISTFSELGSAEHFAAVQMFYEISPCFKLGLFAANYAILEATKDQPKIHILDFDVGQGGQYAALLQALLERHHHEPSVSPPSVRITAVVDPTSPFASSNCAAAAEGPRAIGDRLEKLAERNGLALKFSFLSCRASDLDATALGCGDPDEALAVNMAFFLSRVADESVSPANPRDELLRRVRSLRPSVVTLVEQEINTNTAAFAGRFAETCGHYGALLESLDATEPRESVERARVEAALGRKAANSVAREGVERVERCEVFGKWRARMRMAGLQPIPLGPTVSEPVKARLASFRSNQGFTMCDMGGFGLGLGWMGRVLTVASAWR